MRQITLTIFILVLGQISIFGQDFKSIFGTDTTQWNYVTDYAGADFIATSVFKAYDDTLINDRNYKKLFEDYIFGKQLYGFLFEDTVQGKLWLKLLNDTVDYLLMDLKLSINDTFLLKNSIEESWNRKFIVDTVSNNNGKIIELHGTNGYDNIRFIEGIGVDYIFHLIETPQIYYEFLCSYKDNVIVYDNPNYSECYIPFTSTAISNINKSEISIYPIPTNGQITIDVMQNYIQKNNLKIFDINGRKVLEKEFYSSTIKIDLSSFEKGMYFLKINEIITRKIIFNGY